MHQHLRVLSILAIVATLTSMNYCGGASSNSNISSSQSSSASSNSNPSASSSSNSSASSNSAASGGSSVSAVNGSGSGTAGIPKVQHVAVVVLENTNYADVVGSPNAAYINSLIVKGGLASNYYAILHPSIGNYFALTTGEVATTDDSFTGILTIDNVVRELIASSKTWKSYAQSLSVPGYVGPDIYPYLRRHNPISYFSDVQLPSQQSQNLVPFSQLATDIASEQMPNYMFIVPDAQHDAHDCPGSPLATCDIGVKVAAADTWLSQNIAPLLANAQFQQSGILIITFDESENDNTNGGGRVMTLLYGTGVKPGYVGTATYNHYSLLRLTMEAAGVTTIPGNGSTATDMTEFFQ